MAEGPSPEVQAELVRLDEDIRKLAGRNLWDGVDGVYVRLIELESDGATITMGQHEVGAQGALALGHIQDAVARYERARAAATTPEDQTRFDAVLRDLTIRYAPVALTAGGRLRKEATVQISAAPFANDARAAIAYANAQVAATGTFDGLLPLGDYTFGAATFSLTGEPGTTEVAAGAATTASKPPKEPKPAKERPEKPPKQAAPPRDSGGPGALVEVGIGSGTWASSSLSSGYALPAGTGASVRLGAGGTLPAGAVNLLGKVHWHGVFGGGSDQSSLQLATLSAGVATPGRFQIHLTADLGAGRLAATGVDPGPACAAINLSADATCEGSASWSTTEVATPLLSPGGTVGARFSPPSFGTASIGLDIGLRSVFGQLVTWTALGGAVHFGGAQ